MTEVLTIYTVGHSNRSLEAFVALLRTHGIRRVIDVRRYPGSRRHPHFSKAALGPALEDAGFDYRHAPQLGGHRDPRPESVNTVWEEDAFRGYADHMESEEFARALARLRELGGERPTAVMCAEIDWVGCHRALLSDRLKAEGVEVLHIRDAEPPSEHPWTPQARLEGGRLSYRAPIQGELDL